MKSPYIKIDNSQQDFETPFGLEIEKFEKCSFCNGKLVYNHDMNFHHMLVIETGRCVRCGVTLNPKRYTLN